METLAELSNITEKEGKEGRTGAVAPDTAFVGTRCKNSHDLLGTDCATTIRIATASAVPHNTCALAMKPQCYTSV